MNKKSGVVPELFVFFLSYVGTLFFYFTAPFFNCSRAMVVESTREPRTQCRVREGGIQLENLCNMYMHVYYVYIPYTI